MKIAVDITPLESAHRGRGVGVYTKNLVDALEKYQTGHTYFYFTGKQRAPQDADIVHYPYFDPFFLTLPLVKPKPAVVTVHDLIPLVFPEKFPPGIRGALTWQVQKLSLRGARRIIADSACSKNDIARLTGVKNEVIDVVYLAPDPVFTPENKKPLRREKPYLLYVGDVNWNKNVAGLLRAFSLLKGYNLVLVGSAFTDASLTETAEINSLIAQLHIGRSVRKAGYVSPKDLVHLYRNAACLVVPSWYEGFGLPVLEAMACGCPVVCANTSSLQEIAGPALLVRPNPEDLAAGITKMMTMDTKMQRERQFEWVKKFTWKKVAGDTVVAYERASA